MSAAVQQRPEIKIKLSVVSGPYSGQVFQLNKSTITIGRGPENDIVLMNDPQISRSHAKVAIVDRDLEVINLSSKNAIFVQGESVQKWKIVNNSNFTIGESEFKVEYDLGRAVASVPTDQKAPVLPIKPKKAVLNKNVAVARPKEQQKALANSAPMAPMNRNPVPPAIRSQHVMNPQHRAMPGQINAGFQNTQAANTNGSLMANPKFKFYLVIAIVVIGVYYSFSQPDKKSQAKKIASTLKYEDEINIKMISQEEKKTAEERERRLKEKEKSPQSFRVEESFVRAMRDYQLGNYTRAQESFQLVLNLDPDHALAKRHLYLSKVRFDELVQEKLMLGETYFKKHNFRMCMSMYEQVMDMLNGKNNDQKYQLAEKKARECELAIEGIR